MICLYVKNTKNHFSDKILSGEKTVETRTNRAMRAIQRAGVRNGSTIGIITDGKLVGTVQVAETLAYFTKEAFRSDYSRHCVPEGSAFDFDERKGKTGIVLKSPKRFSNSIPVEKATHPMSFRVVPDCD